jgi:hypothetical protein
VTLDLRKFIRARDESLLDLPFLGRDVPIDGNDLLRIDSLGWVKAEPALSLAPPLSKLLDHCGPETGHGDDPLLIDVCGCFDAVAFKGRFTPGPDTWDRCVLDKEILQVLLELLLEVVAFQFLKPSRADRRQGVPFRM